MPDDSSAAPPALLDPVYAALGERGGLPSAGHTLGRLTRLLESDDEAIAELADLILADVALTQRMLHVANTIPFRTSPGPVTTVTRAIMLLGFDRVRAIAVSLVLLDGLLAPGQAGEVHEEFRQVLLAGWLGRELMRDFDPAAAEEAAIVAMFRNVGRLLVAVYAPDALATVRARARADGVGEASAARRALGLGFEELTALALRAWSVPDRIIAATQPPAGKPGSAAGGTEGLRAVAQLAVELAALARGPAGAGENVAALLGRHAEACAVEPARAAALLAEGLQRTREMEAMLGVPGASLPEPADAGDPVEGAIAEAPVRPTAQRDAVGRPENCRALLLAGLADTADTLARELGSAPRGRLLVSVARVVLEASFLALGWARTALVLRDPAGGRFRTRAAIGDPPARFDFAPQDAGPLLEAALARGLDVHIADAGTAKLRAGMPAWFQRDFAATGSFLLMPLGSPGRPLGFLYADRLVPDPAGVSAEELQLLRALRSQVALALRAG